MIYAPINKIPPLAKLAEQQEAVQYYPTNEKLPASHEQALRPQFNVKYFCTALLTAQRNWPAPEAPPPSGIVVRPIQDVSQNDFTEFTVKTFYQRFGDHQDEQDKKKFVETVPRYFREKIFGKGYYLNGRMIAVIITHQYPVHPTTNTSTLHVGYWGYDRDHVTKQQAQWIKQDWFSSLAQWSADLGGIPVDASVDSFNPAAYKMVTSRGFELSHLRLDRK